MQTRDPHLYPSQLEDLAHAAGVSGSARRARCSTCRLRKVRCSGGPAPCHNCRRLELDCTFRRSTNDASGTHLGDSLQLVSPTESLTEAGTDRRRAATACNECRARKTKCSGSRPQCRRCNSRGMRCIYEGERHTQSPPSSRDRRTLSTSTTEGDSSIVIPLATPKPPASNGSSSLPLDALAEKRLLSRDVLARHIEAYFVYIYHLPGYDIFHRPSLLEDLHNDRTAPILCTAICASVAMYISRSKEGKELSVQWARDVDAHILSSLNNLNTQNLQVMILSMFQHFAYRQFGRVWLIQGMAMRLALGIQLNRADHSGTGVGTRECRKRLAWSLFIQDKIHAGGADEFVGLPSRWMNVPLPLSESDFHNELDRPTGFLSDGVEKLSRGNIGINGYLTILMDIRHSILNTTKQVIARRSLASQEAVQRTLVPLLNLQEQFESFYKSLPAHVALSDRAIFSHSSTPAFTGFISFHTWYFQGCCDLFRICLPGHARESAPDSFLANAPVDFVARWRCSAVSCALKMASTWRRLVDMRDTGVLVFPGGFAPLGPESCPSVYQSTKILLIARRYRLYSGLVDPVSGEQVGLDDDMVVGLCRTNVSFLDDLASVAPVAAVVQRDVKNMIEAEIREVPGRGLARELVPVTSEVQQDKVLSRYNLLAMGIAASSGLGAPKSPSSSSPCQQPVTNDTDPGSVSGQHSHNLCSSEYGSVPMNAAEGGSGCPLATELDSHLQEQQGCSITDAGYDYHGITNNFSDRRLDDLSTDIHFPSYLIPDYAVAASQFNMDGELDWFLMNEPRREEERAREW